MHAHKALAFCVILGASYGLTLLNPLFGFIALLPILAFSVTISEGNLEAFLIHFIASCVGMALTVLIPNFWVGLAVFYLLTAAWHSIVEESYDFKASEHWWRWNLMCLGTIIPVFFRMSTESAALTVVISLAASWIGTGLTQLGIKIHDRHELPF